MKLRVWLIPISCLLLGGAIGLASSDRYQGHTAQEWATYYNNLYKNDMPHSYNEGLKAGHSTGCIDGLVVSRIFLSAREYTDQSNTLIAKIYGEKLNDPYQATADPIMCLDGQAGRHPPPVTATA
jgi:hypothetical protein